MENFDHRFPIPVIRIHEAVSTAEWQSLRASGPTQLQVQLSLCGARPPASLGELVPPLQSEPHGAVWVDWHFLLHGGRRDLGGTS